MTSLKGTIIIHSQFMVDEVGMFSEISYSLFLQLCLDSFEHFQRPILVPVLSLSIFVVLELIFIEDGNRVAVL